MRKGLLFVVSGPSGAGKSTVCGEFTKRADISLSVSMTTRAPRYGEVDGKNYYFVSEKHFLETIADGGLLEYARVYDHYYGTPKAPVTEKLTAGRDVLLEIDTQGALKVKKQYPEGVFIYLLPPSVHELRRRLTERGTETPEAISLRLEASLREMELIDKYDYFIVNEYPDAATDELAAILSAEHARVRRGVRETIKAYKEEMQCCIHQSI
jgi:guanylate kinase